VSAGKVPPPTALIEDFPGDLEQIMLRMLAREREDRYPSCFDVAEALREYLDTTPHKSNEVEVSEAVRATLGQKIDQVTRDLTPSKENFFISLRDGPPANFPGQVAATSSETHVVGQSRRRWLTYAGGAGLLLALLGVAAFFGRSLAPKPPPVETAAPAPPAPVVVPTEKPPPPAEPAEAQRKTKNDAKPAHVASKKSAPAHEVHHELAATTAAEDGFLTLQTTPWTQVSIDGEPEGSTPLFKLRLRAGKHTLHLVNEQAGIDVTRNLTVGPAANEKVSWQLP
jgi:serine/threonine-protein kinase